MLYLNRFWQSWLNNKVKLFQQQRISLNSKRDLRLFINHVTFYLLNLTKLPDLIVFINYFIKECVQSRGLRQHPAGRCLKIVNNTNAIKSRILPFIKVKIANIRQFYRYQHKAIFRPSGELRISRFSKIELYIGTVYFHAHNAQRAVLVFKIRKIFMHFENHVECNISHLIETIFYKSEAWFQFHANIWFLRL